MTVTLMTWETSLFLLAERLLAIIETTTTDDTVWMIDEHIRALADELEIEELGVLEPNVVSINALHTKVVRLVDELSKLAKHSSDQHKQADAWGEAQLACLEIVAIWEIIYKQHCDEKLKH